MICTAPENKQHNTGTSMGVMIDGRWEANETLSAQTSSKGEYIRSESMLRDRIEDAEGAAHPPGSGRYHVFLAHS